MCPPLHFLKLNRTFCFYRLILKFSLLLPKWSKNIKSVDKLDYFSYAYILYFAAKGLILLKENDGNNEKNYNHFIYKVIVLKSESVFWQLKTCILKINLIFPMVFKKWLSFYQSLVSFCYTKVEILSTLIMKIFPTHSRNCLEISSLWLTDFKQETKNSCCCFQWSISVIHLEKGKSFSKPFNS